jgi:AcrR family transcriptional regulator
MAANSKRPYHAPNRQAAAAETRSAIIAAAKETFETRGWPGATMAAIATDAKLSQKTIEAHFGTKAALLRAVVDYAIRGDTLDIPINHRETAKRIDAAQGASDMLDLHAFHVRSIVERTAGVAWVVEHAAAGNPDVRDLWQRMTKNRRSGVKWATDALLSKPDVDPNLERAEIETTFWLALEWGTYRTMTDQHGLSPAEFEQWLRSYYRKMLKH